MQYIYIIENTNTGKFYIGRTNNHNARRRAHFSELRRGVHGNPRLQASYNKHGEGAFVFQVVDSAPKDQIEGKEAEWFAYFNHDKDHLYNCHFETHGGPKIWKPLSEEAKAKISEAIKNGTRKYIFGVLDDGYESRIGLNDLAKKRSVGSSTLIRYKSEWENLRGKKYGHPQIASALDRLALFADEFKKVGPEVTRRMKEFGISYRSIIKYGDQFGLTLENIRLDSWKDASREKAYNAFKYKNANGCSVQEALRATGATTTTFYKYLPTFS